MKNSDLTIPVILGTGRKERRSENVARLVRRQLIKGGAASELVDVREYAPARTIPPWAEDAGAQRWRDIAAAADGYVFVSPEYNHSFPGELKLLLDQALLEYDRKPAAIVSVSTGGFGGVRGQEALYNVLIELGMVNTAINVAFSKIKDVFDENGELQDEGYLERIDEMFRELFWYAKTLKDGKEEYTT